MTYENKAVGRNSRIYLEDENTHTFSLFFWSAPRTQTLATAKAESSRNHGLRLFCAFLEIWNNNGRQRLQHYSITATARIFWLSPQPRLLCLHMTRGSGKLFVGEHPLGFDSQKFAIYTLRRLLTPLGNMTAPIRDAFHCSSRKPMRRQQRGLMSRMRIINGKFNFICIVIGWKPSRQS